MSRPSWFPWMSLSEFDCGCRKGVDDLLQQWSGEEGELLLNIRAKYLGKRTRTPPGPDGYPSPRDGF